jgi:TolA-binding protein
MATVGAVISIIAAVVSTAATVYSVVEQGKATDRAKEAAERQAQIQKDRLENERLQRELQQQKTLAENRRKARNLRADIRNNAAARNVIASSVPITNAISTREQDNRNFVNQSAALAAAADESTKQQIALNKEVTIQAAEDAFSSAVIGGIASTAKTIGATAGAFKGGGTTTTSGAGAYSSYASSYGNPPATNVGRGGGY